jgi:hypothetical protein
MSNFSRLPHTPWPMTNLAFRLAANAITTCALASSYHVGVDRIQHSDLLSLSPMGRRHTVHRHKVRGGSDFPRSSLVVLDPTRHHQLHLYGRLRLHVPWHVRLNDESLVITRSCERTGSIVWPLWHPYIDQLFPSNFSKLCR